MQGTYHTVVGRGEKSLGHDPGSELRLGGRRKKGEDNKWDEEKQKSIKQTNYQEDKVFSFCFSPSSAITRYQTDKVFEPQSIPPSKSRISSPSSMTLPSSSPSKYLRESAASKGKERGSTRGAGAGCREIIACSPLPTVMSPPGS